MTITKNENKNIIFLNGYINSDNQGLDCFDSWLFINYGKYEDDLIISKYLRGLKPIEIFGYLEMLKADYENDNESICYDKIYNNENADIIISNQEISNNYKYLT